MSIPDLPPEPLKWENQPSTATPFDAQVLNPWGDAVMAGAAASRDYAVEARQAAQDAQAPTQQMIENVLDTMHLRQTADTIRIPTDYPTLQEAIDSLSLTILERGATIELRINAGHAPTTGIDVADGDYGMFLITAEDPIVTVGQGFTGPWIRGINATLPTLGCLVDMNDQGEEGYAAWENSDGRVLPHCGVRNSPGRGCHVRGSRVWAPSAEFTGSGDRNLHITGGSFFDGDSGKFGHNKATVPTGARAIYVSRASRASLHSADITNSKGDAAISVLRSQVNATGADVSGAETFGISATNGSMVTFAQGIAQNCGHRAVMADGASSVDAYQADLSGATTNAAFATGGASINAWGADGTNCGLVPFQATTGGTINARDADATGHGASWGFHVAAGAIINANGATGVKSQTANTVTADGIIFG